MGVCPKDSMKQVRSRLSCFDSFLLKLGNWLDEITNYFLGHLTAALSKVSDKTHPPGRWKRLNLYGQSQDRA
jgi:hypothetical protein